MTQPWETEEFEDFLLPEPSELAELPDDLGSDFAELDLETCLWFPGYTREPEEHGASNRKDWIHPMSRYSQYSVIYRQQFRVFAGGGAGESGFLQKKRVPLHLRFPFPRISP
jgi:hypothetical protein